MQYELKVNGNVVAVFMNLDNALTVVWDCYWCFDFINVRINDLSLHTYRFPNNSKTTFKMFSEV